jgi:deoxyribonuclease IV
MSTLLVGAHVRDEDPLEAALEVGAETVQLFLADPQGWKAPKPREDADRLRSAWDDHGIAVYVHAPYVLNVATSNNRIRIPSRKLLAQHAQAAAAIGARGLVVHGGHVTKGEDEQVGYDNWRKVFERTAAEGGFPLPVLIENTAGGDASMARRLDSIARLWEAVGDFGAGFCLDTCHAHAGGIELSSAVERLRGVTGRVDLVHCNDSRDEFDSGRDRHATLGAGRIGLDEIVEVVRQAGAPVVCETPWEHMADDIALLRERLDG